MSRRTDALAQRLGDEDVDTAKEAVRVIREQTTSARDNDRRRRANALAQEFLTNQKAWPTDEELAALDGYITTRTTP
jgi:hypothetical protein